MNIYRESETFQIHVKYITVNTMKFNIYEESDTVNAMNVSIMLEIGIKKY